MLEQDNLFCQHLFGGLAEAVVIPLDECNVPKGVDGPVATFITKGRKALSSDVTRQDTRGIVAGPAVFFVNGARTTLGAAFKPFVVISVLSWRAC